MTRTLFFTFELARRLSQRCRSPSSIRRCIYSSPQAEHFRTSPSKGDRVVVAMSGGVDSSVAAALLAEKDYNLSAIFMRNWDTRDESGTDVGCEWEKDWEDVQRVCKKIDIPCEMIDLSREYWNLVFQPSLELWEQGQTPNPDVWCNREVKFGKLLNHVIAAYDAEWLVTGHYANVHWDGTHPNGRPKLVRSADRLKDQTYYLSAITETSLRKAHFPLNRLAKANVRELGRKYDLPTADREESMGLCFVGERRKFNAFLSSFIPNKRGQIVNLETNKQIGEHQGLWHYTIGQNARVGGMREKMFVVRKNSSENCLFVVPGSTHPALLANGMIIRDFHWIWGSGPLELHSAMGLQVAVQFRHRSEEVPCVAKYREGSGGGGIDITFSTPQFAIAPGQVAAIYLGNWCLGSGIISSQT